MIYRFVKQVALILIIVLVSCSHQVPKCSDESTISTLKKVISQEYLSDIHPTEKEIDSLLFIEYILPVALDKNINKYSCKATLTAGKTSTDILFESQLNDENQQIVSLEKNMSHLVFIFQLRHLIVESRSKGVSLDSPDNEKYTLEPNVEAPSTNTTLEREHTEHVVPTEDVPEQVTPEKAVPLVQDSSVKSQSELDKNAEFYGNNN